MSAMLHWQFYYSLKVSLSCNQRLVPHMKHRIIILHFKYFLYYFAGIINSHSTGIGGGGYMLVYSKEKKKGEVIDFREAAPNRSYPDLFHKDPEKGIRGIKLIRTVNISFMKYFSGLRENLNSMFPASYRFQK